MLTVNSRGDFFGQDQPSQGGGAKAIKTTALSIPSDAINWTSVTEDGTEEYDVDGSGNAANLHDPGTPEQISRDVIGYYIHTGYGKFASNANGARMLDFFPSAAPAGQLLGRGAQNTCPAATHDTELTAITAAGVDPSAILQVKQNTGAPLNLTTSSFALNFLRIDPGTSRGHMNSRRDGSTFTGTRVGQVNARRDIKSTATSGQKLTHVYFQDDQVIVSSAGTLTDLRYDRIIADFPSWASLSNAVEITVNEDGYYVVIANAQCEPLISGRRWQVALFQNGVSIGGHGYGNNGTGGAGVFCTLHGAIIVQAVAGDKFKAQISHDGGADEKVKTGSFIVFKVPLPTSAFHINRSTNQSVNNNTVTDIAFTTEIFDTNNFTNGVTVTIPANGIYLFISTVNWATNGTGDRGSWFAVNGTTVEGEMVFNMGTTFNSNTVCVMAKKMTSGDTIKLQCYQNSGAALNMNFARLAGCLLKAL